jgi:hypothetical protein
VWRLYKGRKQQQQKLNVATMDGVIELIRKEYASEGVEYESSGDGIVWVAPPPNFRDIGDFCDKLRELPGVSTIDSEIDGTNVRYKIFINDSATRNSVAGCTAAKSTNGVMTFVRLGVGFAGLFLLYAFF